MDKIKEVRVRLAPSPTGPFHIGTARTALFNWLFARHNNGSFILRIDDTDQERNDIRWEREILENLSWLGLNWDEGPILSSFDKNRYNNPDEQRMLKLKEGYLGEYGPYHQSKRTDIYKKYLNYLLDNNLAYRCFCRPEELKIEKEAMISAGQIPKYSGRCRSLTSSQVEEKLKKGEPYVIRIKTPEKKISFIDLIRGKITFDMNLIGDFIIAKGIERPLYNFTSVVDDYEMKITHVIRGEDHISNTPKQIIIQELLGFPGVKYAHIPLILNPGRKKLSKRDGGFSVQELKEKGYLPEAILNFLSLLGWHPESDQEFFSTKEAIEMFSIEKIQKSPAIFLTEKLNWLNSKYIKSFDIDKLVSLIKPYIKIPKYSEIMVDVNDDYLKKVVLLFQDRITTLSEINELADFFFKRINYSKDLLIWKNESPKLIMKSLEEIKQSFISMGSWNKNLIEENLFKIADKIGDRGVIFWPLRVALSGKKASPSPIEIAEILGKNESIERISKAIDKLKHV